MNTGLLAASHAGRYANAAVLLILGLFVLFMAYAVSMRVSLPVDVHDPLDDVLDGRDDDADSPGAADWIEGERRRRRLAVKLRPVLLVVGTGLLVASALAALISWI
jgi:hypothetical protein